MSNHQRIELTDFGILPDSGQDAVPAIQRAIATCAGFSGMTLMVPPGRYDLFPDKAAHLHYDISNTEPINPRTVAMPLCGLDGFTLEATGAIFVYHGRMMPIVIDDCRDIRINGLTIDAAVPSICQGRIEAVTDESIDIFIEENADVRIEEGKLVRYGEGWSREIWGHQLVDGTGSVVYNTGDNPLGTLHAEQIDSNRFRLQKPVHRSLTTDMVLILRSGWRDHSAIFLYRSRDVTLEEITIHFANGTGIMGQRCENITMVNSHVIPAPGRVYSTFADATHWSGNRGQLTIENCRFAGHLDDAANVHGTSTVVQEIVSPRKILGSFRHWETVGLLWAEPGDVISFFSRRTLIPIATATVQSFRAVNAETFLLEFDSDLPTEITVETAMENLTWNPAFTFRGNTVRRHRARGILISTPGITRIENNIFSSPGAAIVIAGDANGWFESGSVHDVLIQGNIFDNCNTSPYGSGAGIIHIDPVIPELDINAPCYHQNIRVIANQFRAFDTPYLAALSVDSLIFCGNTIIDTDKFPPRINSPYGLIFDACRNVIVEENRFDLRRSEIQIIDREQNITKQESSL